MIDYNSYLKVCKEAIENEEIFKNFKRHLDYTPILEHVSFSQGLEYLEEIKKICPSLLQHLNRFATNDSYGNPNVYYYGDLKMHLSPTTLRYIKVLADLINLFGDLNGMNIIEIGCGYGGQCKIIHDIFKIRNYTLIDLPSVVQLSIKYLKEFNIETKNNDGTYDLFISNYAFTEIEKKYQDIYTEKFIRISDRGYITCNFITSDNMTKEEIFDLKINYKVYEERPLTGGGNLIYTWNL